MLIIGIIVSIFSILLVIFPKIFLNLKSPDTAFLRMKKINNNEKVILIVRVWGMIFLVVGMVLVLMSFR